MPARAFGHLNAGQLVDSSALRSTAGKRGTLAQAGQSPFMPVYTGGRRGETMVPGPLYPTVTFDQDPGVTANNAYQHISNYFSAPGRGLAHRLRLRRVPGNPAGGGPRLRHGGAARARTAAASAPGPGSVRPTTIACRPAAFSAASPAQPSVAAS